MSPVQLVTFNQTNSQSFWPPTFISKLNPCVPFNPLFVAPTAALSLFIFTVFVRLVAGCDDVYFIVQNSTMVLTQDCDENRVFKWEAVSLSVKWALHSFKASYKWSHQIKRKTYQMGLTWFLWSKWWKVLEEFSLMDYIMIIKDVRVDHGHA